MVGLQARTRCARSWVRLETDAASLLAGWPHRADQKHDPGRAELINRFRCEEACDPETNNPIAFRVPVKAERFAAALKVTDVTDARRERPLTKSKPRQRESWEQDRSEELSLEDAGFSAQPPAATFLAVLPADLQAERPVLGYTWAGQVETGTRARDSFATDMAYGEKRRRDPAVILPEFPAVRMDRAGDPQQMMPKLLKLQDRVCAWAPQRTRPRASASARCIVTRSRSTA